MSVTSKKKGVKSMQTAIAAPFITEFQHEFKLDQRVKTIKTWQAETPEGKWPIGTIGTIIRAAPNYVSVKPDNENLCILHFIKNSDHISLSALTPFIKEN